MNGIDEILTKLWVEVINLNHEGQWLESFVKNPKAKQHPITKALQVLTRLARADLSREDLGRIGRARRYEVCFGTLYAIDDPGLASGKLAGLDTLFPKMETTAARKKSKEPDFFSSMWEMIHPKGAASDWKELAATKLSNEPFGDTGPAVKRLLAQGVKPEELQTLQAWHEYEACRLILKLLAESFTEADEAFGLHESLLGSDPSGKEGRPGSWPAVKSSKPGKPPAKSKRKPTDPPAPYLIEKSLEDFIFLPGNQLMVAIGKSGPIRLLDIYTGIGKAEVSCTADGWDCFTWSPDGEFLAVSFGNALAVCRTKTGKLLKEIPRPEAEYLDWRPEGILSISGFHKPELVLTLLDEKTLIEKKKLPVHGLTDDLNGFGFSPHGKRLGFAWRPPRSTSQFAFWSWPECDLLTRRDGGALSWEWGFDGNTILMQEIGVTSAATGEIVWDLKAEDMRCIPAMSPDGEWLVTGTQKDGKVDITIWKTRDHTKLRTFSVSTFWCFKLAFSPDGKVLGLQSHKRALFFDFPTLLAT